MDNNYDMSVNDEVKYYDSPNLKENCGGLLLGLVYLYVLPSFLYTILRSFANPHTLADLNVIMLIAEISSVIITMFAVYLVCKRNFKNLVASFKKIEIKSALKYMVYLIAAGVAYNYLLIIFNLSPETNANQASLNEAYAYAPVLTILYTCIFAPVIEETIFRYFIYKPVSKKNKVLAMILSGVAFGLIHMISTFSIYASTKDSATLINDLLSLPDYIIAGIIFSLAYAKTNKLSTSIVAHSFYNIFATVTLALSTAQSPLRYQKVEVGTNDITITYKINDELNTFITKIELYTYNEDDTKHVLETLTVLNNNVLVFDELESSKLYYIDTTYKYDTTTKLNTTESVEEVLTYYAKTR